MRILQYLKREEQYYPTPARFVEKILDFGDVRESFYGKEEINFLDVGAGDGNISDVVKGKFRERVTVNCVEINQILSACLRDKGYKVVGGDFREFTVSPEFDLIVMNPPFKNGATFTRRAYSCLRAGGKLISIVNAESIRNPCTKERELLLSMIELNGDVEYFKDIFTDAARKTDVEVAVVYLEKPFYESEFDFFGKLKEEVKSEEDLIKEKFESNITEAGLIQYNKLDSAISLYRSMVEKSFESIEMVSKLKTNFSLIEKENSEFELKINDFIKIILEENNPTMARDKTVKLVRKIMWNYILKFLDVDRFLFSKQREQFFSELDKGIGDLPFNKNFIQQFLDNIFIRRKELFKDGVIDLFNETTRYHDGNRNHTEGWKTNKNWKIPKKIIMPWGIRYEDNRQWGGRGGSYKEIYSYSNCICWITDLDKIVRLIDKNPVDWGYIIETLNQRFRELGTLMPGQEYINTATTPYFKLKWFKKGTLHIEFIDDKILEEINFMGANYRRDLGYEV